MLTKVHLVKAMVLPVVTYGCESWTIKKLSSEELMLLNCGVGDDSWESLGLQGDPISPPQRNSVLNIHWKDWCWIETPILWLSDGKNWLIWNNLDAGKDSRLEGEGDDRGWGGWMASPTRWMWVWVNSGSWWWTGRPGVPSPWGRKELDTTERLNWTVHSIFLAFLNWL